MYLIDAKTGVKLNKGDTVETFRGEAATLIGWLTPTSAGSTGRVVVRFDNTTDHSYYHSYFPSVIGATWKEDK